MNNRRNYSSSKNIRLLNIIRVFTLVLGLVLFFSTVLSKSTYGIFTGYKYDDMWLYKEPEMYKYLFQIAYINLSKMPAYTTSGDMTSKYYAWRDIVLKQIDLFQPNVIIFGGTFQYIKDDLGIDETYLIHSEENWKLNIYKKNDTLYIETYHPGVRRSPRTYVNMIANSIKEFKKQINIYRKMHK